MKKFLVALITILSFVPGFSETVSQKQAQQLAYLFFNEAAGRVTAPPKLIYNGRRLTTNRLFTPFYVYNTPLGGFVIISAENKAYPILGFSLKESFDPEKLGETEKQLLESYALEIERIRYDSTPVDNVEKAWQNYPEYVDGILKSKYEATDPKLTLKESSDLIFYAIENEDAIYSDMYTPEQWQEMILEELAKKESVPLSIVGIRESYPMVVFGHQGDYFRIEMDRRNSWLMRLNATDIISASMVSVVGKPLELLEEDYEEPPFRFHEDFLSEVQAEEDNRKAVPSIVKSVIEGQPQLRPLGSGHFEISIPEPVIASTVYNLAGAIVKHQTYKGTDVANIDISPEPTGFYFARVVGESGTPYGFKLYR